MIERNHKTRPPVWACRQRMAAGIVITALLAAVIFACLNIYEVVRETSASGISDYTTISAA